MSMFRRYVATRLLRNINNEKAFIETVREEVTSMSLKPKDAEKAVIWYYQDRDKLVRKLEQDSELYGF